MTPGDKTPGRQALRLWDKKGGVCALGCLDRVALASGVPGLGGCG